MGCLFCTSSALIYFYERVGNVLVCLRVAEYALYQKCLQNFGRNHNVKINESLEP